ncbi:Metallo-beta-lactamase superfamily protein [Favolaschia claudopus]|uniref:Metallo-beta-lactamase superfamily protein n=1 Tax=Favolaschia claudopus TaxID=2862362 RepID=A0AAW0D637_9AGAR
MSFRDLGIPAAEATVSVKAYNVTDDTMSSVRVPASIFWRPVLSGRENFTAPVFAFLIEHATTGRRVMFDIGMRKDPENGAPHLVEMTKAGFSIPVNKDITERLVEDGVPLDSISSVIWSHAHLDHIGDISKFPATTDLVVGGATSLKTWQADPKSILSESDVSGRKIVLLKSEDSLEIGGFKAHDFFGDGSLYLLDVPGHFPGHVCGLARVTPTTFVLLGGDACHHAGMFRPTTELHRRFPCPGELLSATRHSVSKEHFASPGSSEFDLAARNTPMFEVIEGGAYADPAAARDSIAKIGPFDANEDIFIAMAHDESLVDTIGPYPLVMDSWKEKGWKNQAIWASFDEKNRAFRYNVKEGQN